MAINIFANAEKAIKPKSEIVGRFRAGRQLQGRPMSLDTWRVTTGDPEVAQAIADTFGAKEGPQKWDTKSDEVFEVITEVDEVNIIIPSEKCISSEMVLWGRKGKVRSCDGVTMADGSPCVCPSDFSERIEAAKNGTACEPSIGYLFKLADLPDIGSFRFQTGSWTVARYVSDYEEQLASIGGPAVATLALESRTRKATGTSYTIAVINEIKKAA